MGGFKFMPKQVIENRLLTRSHAYGDLAQEKTNLVGVRGYLGGMSGKDNLDKSGSPYTAAVLGIDDTGQNGVVGSTDAGRGVAGLSNSGQGVYGHSVSQAGVVGESDHFDGVAGISHKKEAAGVSGHNPQGLAGYFDGHVFVTG